MYTTHSYRKSKPVSASSVENQRIKIFTQEIAPHELFFGGSILQIVEKIAAQVAEKHLDGICTTKGIDFVRFYSPVKRGDILLCSASVNRVWEEGMEVGLTVIAEDFRTLEQKKTLCAYFHFAPKDESSLLPFVIPETKDQVKRYHQAELRRQIRRSQAEKKSY